jgi:hypothetical protein
MRLQEAARQFALVEGLEKGASADKARAQAAFRGERRNQHAMVHGAMATLEAHVRAEHAASQARRHRLEAGDLQVEMTLAKKAAARRELARSVVAIDVRTGIEAFEMSLARTTDGGSEGPATEGLPAMQTASRDRIMAFQVEQDRMEKDAKVCFRLRGLLCATHPWPGIAPSTWFYLQRYPTLMGSFEGVSQHVLCMPSSAAPLIIGTCICMASSVCLDIIHTAAATSSGLHDSFSDGFCMWFAGVYAAPACKTAWPD